MLSSSETAGFDLKNTVPKVRGRQPTVSSRTRSDIM